MYSTAHDFPPFATVHSRFLRLARTGAAECGMHALAMAARERAGRDFCAHSLRCAMCPYSSPSLVHFRSRAARRTRSEKFRTTGDESPRRKARFRTAAGRSPRNSRR